MATIATSPAVTPFADLLDLDDKVAVVTGGAKGIGWGISRRLAEAGASILIADLDYTGAGDACATLEQEGLSTRPFHIDVAEESQVKALFEFAKQELGGVDIVVNDAGIFPQVPIREMTAEVFDRVIAVNLRGLYLCTKYGAEAMIEQGRGGKIINITSIDAVHPSMVGLAHYDASKHGAWGFTKNAALEYAPYGIAVNAIAPGGITTPGTAVMEAGPDTAAMLEAFLQRIPMRRMGEPDDIGKVALFLACDMSSYMTGAQVVVDGGALLG
jgi:2-dehydro-3-deoxy-D-gluconate 5-dehydrogenase